MLKYVVKRLLMLIPVIVLVSIMLFVLLKAMPGDPVRMMLPPGLTGEDFDRAYEIMYKKLLLDKSYAHQYVAWFSNMLKGDFGYSSMQNRPVIDAIKEPLRNTVVLNILVITLQICISLPVGIHCAVKRGSLFDKFWQVFSLVGYSMPSFFIGLSLIYIVALKLRFLPPGGMPLSVHGKDAAYYLSWLKYMILPALSLTFISIAGTIRYVRNAMLEAMNQDYIRTARSKGLSEKVVIYSHAFRNALIPISTITIWTIFSVFSGSAITETVFAWNGIGHVLVKALQNRDFSLVITLNMLTSVIAITANLVADVSYGLIDPRIKLE